MKTVTIEDIEHCSTHDDLTALIVKYGPNASYPECFFKHYAFGDSDQHSSLLIDSNREFTLITLSSMAFLKNDEFVKLSKSSSICILGTLVLNTHCPPGILEHILNRAVVDNLDSDKGDQSSCLLISIAGHHNITANMCHKLLQLNDDVIDDELTMNNSVNEETLEIIFNKSYGFVKESVLRNKNVPQNIVNRVVKDHEFINASDSAIWLEILAIYNFDKLTDEFVELLSNNEDSRVRYEVKASVNAL